MGRTDRGVPAAAAAAGSDAHETDWLAGWLQPDAL